MSVFEGVNVAQSVNHLSVGIEPMQVFGRVLGNHELTAAVSERNPSQGQ